MGYTPPIAYVIKVKAVVIEANMSIFVNLYIFEYMLTSLSCAAWRFEACAVMRKCYWSSSLSYRLNESRNNWRAVLWFTELNALTVRDNNNKTKYTRIKQILKE